MRTEKEIKQEIKRLRRLKLKCRAGTDERLDLEHTIKELKADIIRLNTIEPDKAGLIQEILAKDKLITDLGINLNKFSVKDLEIHLKKLNEKRGI